MSLFGGFAGAVGEVAWRGGISEGRREGLEGGEDVMPSIAQLDRVQLVTAWPREVFGLDSGVCLHPDAHLAANGTVGLLRTVPVGTGQVLLASEGLEKKGAEGDPVPALVEAGSAGKVAFLEVAGQFVGSGRRRGRFGSQIKLAPETESSRPLAGSCW